MRRKRPFVIRVFIFARVFFYHRQIRITEFNDLFLGA